MNKFELLAGLMALPISANARLAIFWIFESFNSKDSAYFTWMGDKSLAEKLNCSLSTAKRAIAEVINLAARDEPIFRYEIIGNDALLARTQHRPKKDQGRGNPQNCNRFLTLNVEAAVSVIGDTCILSAKKPISVKGDTNISVTLDTHTSVKGELRTPEVEPSNSEPRNGTAFSNESAVPRKRAESRAESNWIEEFLETLS